MPQGPENDFWGDLPRYKRPSFATDRLDRLSSDGYNEQHVTLRDDYQTQADNIQAKLNMGIVTVKYGREVPIWSRKEARLKKELRILQRKLGATQ